MKTVTLGKCCGTCKFKNVSGYDLPCYTCSTAVYSNYIAAVEIIEQQIAQNKALELEAMRIVNHINERNKVNADVRHKTNDELFDYVMNALQEYAESAVKEGQ